MLKPSITLATAALAALSAACAPYPQRVQSAPVLRTNDKLPEPRPPVLGSSTLPPEAPALTAEQERERFIAQLKREGDDLVLANDLVGALNRYDRASVLKPNDPDLLYKSARILDLQLRPAEALMRYQKFLLELDLQRIKAEGDANAKMAEAIALAQQRIVVLQKQVK